MEREHTGGTVAPASVRLEKADRRMTVFLAGDWRALSAPSLECPAFEPGAGGVVGFDMSAVSGWGTALPVFVDRVLRCAEAHGQGVALEGLTPDVRRLMELARSVPEKSQELDDHCGGLLARLGCRLLGFSAASRDVLTFTGLCMQRLWAMLTGRANWRLGEVLHVAEFCGPRALPIVALISFLVGVIVTFLGAVVLRRMGAQIYVSYLLGFGVLREMGALMVGIIMAGRTGAAFAAKIGSMKVSGEIDALTTLGVSPIDFLVLPRMMALVLMMPLLTLFADVIGIGGGYMVSRMLFQIPASQFFAGMREVTGMTDLVVGLVKSVLFGKVIAFAGCLRGMQCGIGSDAVGVAATSAVVTGITLIVVVNALVDWMAIIYGV